MLPLDERKIANFDHPDSLDIDNLTRDLKLLRTGNNVEIPVYNFSNHTREADTIRLTPKPVTIIEGILILTIPELRELMDIKIYLDTSSDTRLLRRIRRDIEERGRTLEQTLLQYEKTIRPMHHQFVEPVKEFADLVVPEGGHSDVLVEMLSALVNSKLDNSATTLQA
jgi:uridine kinase